MLVFYVSHVLCVQIYHKVSEADSSERDDTVVDRVEVTPTFVMREHGSTARDHEYRQGTWHAHSLGLIHIGRLGVHNSLDKFNAEWGKVVQAVAHRLKHDQAQRYADDWVEYTEKLAKVSVRSCMAVSLL